MKEKNPKLNQTMQDYFSNLPFKCNFDTKVGK